MVLHKGASCGATEVAQGFLTGARGDTLVLTTAGRHRQDGGRRGFAPTTRNHDPTMNRQQLSLWFENQGPDLPADLQAQQDKLKAECLQLAETIIDVAGGDRDGVSAARKVRDAYVSASELITKRAAT